jgi:tripartite-type tricarboxylate transporter receptor subunit TctC
MLRRRTFLKLGAAAMAASARSAIAAPAPYPARPIYLIVGFSAGGNNFATLPGSIQFIRAGSSRALAVTASERSSALPEVAAMAEFFTGL